MKLSRSAAFRLAGPLALLLALLLVLAACASDRPEGGQDGPESREVRASLPFEAETIADGPVARTDTLELLYDGSDSSISVRDLRSGRTWNTLYDPESLPDAKINNTWKQNMQSLFIVSFSDKSAQGRDQVVTASMAKLDPVMEACRIDGGIRIRYTFPSMGLSFMADFGIEGSAFSIRVPSDGLDEASETRLLALEAAPFLGAARNDETGYILYPDGSGALLRFSAESGSRRATAYRMIPYGTDAFDFANDRVGEDSTARSTASRALLPAFGMKSGTGAYVALLTEGEADAAVNVYPSGLGVPLYRVAPSFQFRRTYGVYPTTVDNPSSTLEKPLFIKIDDRLIDSDKEVRYYFLEEGSADYGGMASTCRQVLLEEGKLVDRIQDGDPIPASLELFMGTTRRRFLLNEFVVTTDFRQAEAIVRDLDEAGIPKAFLTLWGWYRNGQGAYPASFLPAPQLGGRPGLGRLASLCRDMAWPLSLEVDPIDIVKANGGFSTRGDIVLDGNGYAVQDRTSSRYLFNPVAAFRRTSAGFDTLSDLGIDGVFLTRIGAMTYDDYQRRNPTMRSETVDRWRDLLREAQERFGHVAVDGGNGYVLALSDHLVSIGEKDSGFVITDESVPFYQMVVHSYIPCSGQVLNLSHDAVAQVLRWVEQGTMPAFRLTWESPALLRDTDANTLFSSRFDLWRDDLVRIVSDFNQRLAPAWNSPVRSHASLSKTLKRVEYENGVTVYVNYGYEAADWEGVRVPAREYLVLDPGEGTP